MKLGSSLKRTRRGRGSDGQGGGAGTRRRRRRGGRGFPASPRRLLAGVALLLLGLGGGYLVATRLLFPAPPPPGNLYEVPDVQGLPFASAAERVREVGLEVGVVDSLRHPTVEAGRIVGQAPLPRQLALPDAPVRLTVSLGAERREVPDVVRLRGDRARNVLEATGFHVEVDSVESDAPRGTVVGVRPEPGEERSLPEGVRLEVSLGPSLVPMPLLLGMTEEEALGALRELDLVVSQVDTVFRFGRDQGLVVEQEPPADSLVERGSAVRLSVGRRGGGGEQ